LPYSLIKRGEKVPLQKKKKHKLKLKIEWRFFLDHIFHTRVLLERKDTHINTHLRMSIKMII
jgi:hypothetical protein